MIDITIYIEGVALPNQVAGTPEVLTVGNAAIFRENFYKLFSQQLSPKKIEQFGANEGLIRKKRDEDIASNPLIKNRHPEEISKPSEKLDTIFRQYFDKLDRQGKAKAIGYSKAKDGPKLIGLLELDVLMLHFDEVKRLVDYIQG